MEDHKAEIDRHKEELLRKQKDGKGEWKGELSSNSEAAVCFSIFSSIFYASSSCCQRRLVWEKRRRANGICREGNRLKQIERDRIR